MEFLKELNFKPAFQRIRNWKRGLAFTENGKNPERVKSCTGGYRLFKAEWPVRKGWDMKFEPNGGPSDKTKQKSFP